MQRMNRGDTIIEVLLAVTIFSLISTGAMTIMNQSANASQRALEITHVRQQIDGQAQAIRAAHQAATAGDPADWNSIKGADTSIYYSDPNPTVLEAKKKTCPSTIASFGATKPFAMNSRTGSPVTGASFNSKYANTDGANSLPYAQVSYDAGANTVNKVHSIWVERQKIGTGGYSDSYEFVVHACWFAAGVSQPMQLETVVRLYDPGT